MFYVRATKQIMCTEPLFKNAVAWRLKAGIVELKQTSIARQQLGNISATTNAPVTY
jgi:hypothetical protein